MDIDVKHSQEPQLKKAFVDTDGIGVNALIDDIWNLVLYCTNKDDWGIYTRTSRNQCFR